MRAIDTNVLLRLIIRDDELQLAAAEAFIEKGAWISLIVAAETMWVLSSLYKASPQEVSALLEVLLDNPLLSFQEPEIVRAALSQLRRRPSLKFADCLVLELARGNGYLPLGTFDRDLSKLDGTERL